MSRYDQTGSRIVYDADTDYYENLLGKCPTPLFNGETFAFYSSSFYILHMNHELLVQLALIMKNSIWKIMFWKFKRYDTRILL